MIRRDWLDSRSILKVKPTGFPDGLNMGYEGKSKNGSKVFGLGKKLSVFKSYYPGPVEWRVG